ncbi:glycosyltransferase [Aquiflexum gelatinilyticum]|uniref:glycosyltransferase n=1 Tax=Aquiflexum gelatinilyticum TaxID=2961943 RepID=UPI0021686187|nr:glycosyltransferase [Aquiflexum gelatinilyticum]MCS4434567.1 glycosyltransferase [Aquiflexum gelatinilyticum]
MKILRIVSELDFGGVEQVVALSVPALSQKSGVKIKVIVLGKGGRISERLAQKGFEVLVLNKDTKIPNFQLVYQLKNIFEKEQVDVVHTQGAEANFHGIWAAKLAGVKTKIGEEIGLPNHHSYWKWIFKWVYKKADHVIAISESVKNTIISLGEVEGEKVKLLYNPVGLGNFGHGDKELGQRLYKSNNRGLEEVGDNLENMEVLGFTQDDGLKPEKDSLKPFVFVTTCRLVPIKNLDRLIQSFAKVKQINPNKEFELWLIGEGPEKENLNKLSNRLELGSLVRFFGFREDVSGFLREADVFILPSLSEGSSVSLAEAMMAGLPAIVTEVGGAKEILGESNSGILVNPYNEDSIFSAMQFMVDLSEEERIKMGRSAKKESERFSVEGYVASLMEVYRG